MLKDYESKNEKNKYHTNNSIKLYVSWDSSNNFMQKNIQF